MFFVAFLLPGRVFAVGCDQATLVGCTFCKFGPTVNTCVVDTSKSTCGAIGYTPDPGYCNVTNDTICDQRSALPGNCLPPPTPTVTITPGPGTISPLTPTPSACFKCDPTWGCVPDTTGCHYTYDACVNGCSSQSLPVTPPPTSGATAGTPALTDISGGGRCSSDPSNPQVWTALGCISTDPAAFISKILGIGVGIGGGVAFLLILFGGFQILTSAGNPEKLNAGKELVTSAITGLLIIIFSLFILQLIGFKIFAIPGFG
jgi:hypothetical protein